MKHTREYVKVEVQITVTRYANVAYQDYDDPDDGTRKGYYGWVRSAPGEQADFIVGPCDTAEEALEEAKQAVKRDCR